MNKDAKHLQLLTAFHYVLGGIGLLLSFFPLIHITMGLEILRNPAIMTVRTGLRDQPPEMGWFLIVVGAFFMAMGIIVSLCVILSGRFLALRKLYWFSFAIACVECLFVPFGTALGICTFVVLHRDSVKDLYYAPAEATAEA